MILHTINKPEKLLSCTELIEDSDLVLLMEDGVYLANDSIPGVVHALRTDVLARGFKIPEKAENQIDRFQGVCRAHLSCG